MTERTKVPHVADERTMLEAFLAFQRDTFRMKTAGLDADGLAAKLPPSTLTLGGLVKHLALVEDWWFGINLLGTETMAPFGDVDWDADPDWEFHTAADDSPEGLRDLYERAVAASEANLATIDDLDHVIHRRNPKTGEDLSTRWVVLHMIEEYARHNGHADLIRESVDGQTGS
jgi:uncharacterized damage-inducible protein DinB